MADVGRCRPGRDLTSATSSNSCISYSVVVDILVSVTTTIIKGARSFGVQQDTEPVSSMFG